MGRKSLKISEIERFITQNPDVLSQFQDVNAKNITQPSILIKGGIQTLDIKRLPPAMIEQALILHPVIPRGIEIKANRITSRGFQIKPRRNTSRARDAARRCNDLVRVSGGEILINGWIRDSYAFGNGYLTLLADKDSGDITYISKEHPVFFRIARKKLDNQNSRDTYMFNIAGDFDTGWADMKIDPVTKKPLAYTQVTFVSGDKEKVVPIGQEIDAERVAHLVFFTWGDEAEGIGVVQYVYNILRYMLNIEEAGAEAIFRSGFTQKKVTTEINTERELKQLAKNLDKINSSDALILPRGTDVENLIPGSTDFPDVHDIFMNLIAIRLGVPKPILTLDGTDTNKATMQELMRDLIYDLHADEIRISNTIEQQIFMRACENWYGESFDDEDLPLFVFNDFEEGREEKATVMNLTADYIVKLTNAYKLMTELNQPEVASKIARLLITNIPIDEDSPSAKAANDLLVTQEPVVTEPVKEDVPIKDNL